MECFIVRGKSFYFVFLLIFFSACTQTELKPPYKTKQTYQKPLWLTNPKLLTAFQAVGFSPPNFQGMQIQRTQAMAKAREILSQRISCKIISYLKNKVQTNKKSSKKNYASDITSISKHLLQNSYQADAYLDERGNLYLLMQINKGIDTKNILSNLETTPFSIKPLLARRCYAKETLLKIQTKAPMYHDKPLWFYRPNKDANTIRGIGIAEKVQNSTLDSQKKVATTLAKLTLAQRKNLRINSIDNLSTVVSHDELEQIEDWHTRTKTRSKITNVRLLDLWMDPQQCELYVLVKKY